MGRSAIWVMVLVAGMAVEGCLAPVKQRLVARR